jgi:tetratricopeptide (TPR) repeat protein
LFGKKTQKTRHRRHSATYAGVMIISAWLCLRAGPAEARNRAVGLMWEAALKGARAAVSGRYKTAHAHFTQALQWVKSPEIAGARTLCAYAMGRRQKAQKSFNRLTATRTAFHGVHYWAARLSMAARDYRGACTHARNAVNLGGDRPPLLVLEAAACHKGGKRPAAARALMRATQKTADLLDGRLYPGLRGGVLGLVLRSLNVFPRKQSAYLTIGHLYFQARHYRAAEALADRVRDKWGHVHEAFFLKARCRLIQGDLNTALKWINRALAARPADPAALAVRAQIFMLQKKNARAVSDLERSIRANPKEPFNLTRLGHLLWKKGHYGRAEKMFRYALARFPSLASAHHGLARAADRLKKPKRAEIHFQTAIKNSPSNPIYRKAYAVFLQRRKRETDARRQLKIARTLDRFRDRLSKKMSRIEKIRTAQKKVIKEAQKSNLNAAKKKLAQLNGPRSLKRFLRARLLHLAKKKSLAQARAALSGLARRAVWSLKKRVTIVSVSGKADGGKIAFRQQQYLPYANPLQFR